MSIRDRIHAGLGVSGDDIGFRITLGLGRLSNDAGASADKIGLEYTAARDRLHYGARLSRMHFRVNDDRLHYQINDKDTESVR